MRNTYALSAAVALCAALLLPACSSGSDNEGPTSEIIGTERWSADRVVSSDLIVQGTLTIDPGVSLRFAPGTSLSIASGGSLIAEGTIGAGVTLEARDSGSPWGGLRFESGSAGSRLAYCDLSGAGAGGRYAVVFGQGASAWIRLGRVRDNAAGGIDASAAGAGTVIHQNHIYGNDVYGLRVNGNVDTGSVAASESNWLYPEGGGPDLDDPYCKIPFSGSSVTMNAILDSFTVPYLFEGNVNMESGGTLTILDGTLVQIAPRVLVTVKSGGRLFVVGDENNGAHIEAASATERWRGLFLDAGSSGNDVRYCSIKGAGSNGECAIGFGMGAGAAIVGCGFDGNAVGGLDAMYANGSLTSVTGCYFYDNGDADGNGIYDMVMGGGTYTGNFGNHIVSASDL
jgi:hypothetical protein